MPSYEYKCSSCGKIKFTDSRLPPHWGHIEVSPDEATYCGTFKRVWSFGIVWPKSERGH